MVPSHAIRCRSAEAHMSFCMHAHLLQLTRLPATHLHNLHLLCWRLTQALPAEMPPRAGRRCVTWIVSTQQVSACRGKKGRHANVSFNCAPHRSAAAVTVVRRMTHAALRDAHGGRCHAIRLTWFSPELLSYDACRIAIMITRWHPSQSMTSLCALLKGTFACAQCRLA